MKDFIVNDEESLAKMLAKVRAAQEKFATYTQEQVDEIFYRAALAANKMRIPLAKMAVEETGMGIVEDKVIKNHYASEYIYNQYKDKVNNVLDEADKYTGMVDGVLGTNLGGVVDGAQGVTDGITNAGDSIVNKGNEYAGIGADIQGGINSGLGAINDFKNKQNNKNGNTAEGAPAAGNTNTSGGSNTTGGSASGGTSGLGMTSALTGPGTNNGYAVLPNELADYCGIQAADINDVTKKGVVVNCLKKLITYRNSKTLEDQRAARDIYVKSFHDTAYANVAEAVVMRNYAVNYEREVLTPLSEKLKKAKTIRDDYSGVVIVNKEVANLLNRILMVYASKVSFDALRDYGDFEIYPEDLLELD